MANFSGQALEQHKNTIRIGSIAAVLIAASIAYNFISFASITSVKRVSDEAEAATFLNDLAKHQDLIVSVIFVGVLTAVALVALAVGLYEGLSPWSTSLLGVTRIALILSGVMVTVTLALEAPIAGYIVPTWAGTSDAAEQARLAVTTTSLSWADDAVSSMINMVAGIGIGAASVAMLQIGRQWWRVLGWIGIVGAIASILSAFSLLSSVFDIASVIDAVLILIWLLGTSFGLWQMSATVSTAESPATGTAAMSPGGSGM